MKLVLVRPYLYSEVSYIQLTNRRIYLTWEDSKLLEEVPFYEDKECALEPSFPGSRSMSESYHEAWPEPGGHFSP
jgi:hypothetical protein